uniref:Uncharacterized protein n=1 Tax=Trichogramma kaykai TaxID=54128 RepID=A0ABD2WLU6_9HYME
MISTPIKSVDKFIVENVPAKYRHNARNLVEWLPKDGSVKWAENGSISIDGSSIDGNIIDFVKDTMRSRKGSPLRGIRQLIEALQKASVPREFIGNKQYQRFVVSPPEISGNDLAAESKSEADDEKLYHGATWTVKEFVLAIGLLKSSLGLPDTHLSQPLKFVGQILPQPNNSPCNLYKFKKFFNCKGETILTKHYHCPSCTKLCENTCNDVDNDEVVENDDLDMNGDSCDCGEKKDYFIEIPLISQLECLYQRSGFFDQLQKSRSRVNLSNYGDIYDGNISESLKQNNNILSHKNNISFMWYTDGVRIFKSSKYNIWGFALIIFELPYSERYKIQNMLLVALWFGDHKPVPNIFLKPLKKSLKKLYEGVDFYIQDLGEVSTVKRILLCGTADLPAKALFLNMNQYNGKFSCQICYQNGRTVEKRRVYAYDEDIYLRTEESVLENVEQMLEINKPVRGIKGPSIISKICPNFITGSAIDVMHNSFEGVTKKLLEL